MWHKCWVEWHHNWRVWWWQEIDQRGAARRQGGVMLCHLRWRSHQLGSQSGSHLHSCPNNHVSELHVPTWGLCHPSSSSSSFLGVISTSHMARNMIFRLLPFSPSCPAAAPTPRPGTALPGAALCCMEKWGALLPSCIHSTNIEMPSMHLAGF